MNMKMFRFVVWCCLLIVDRPSDQLISIQVDFYHWLSSPLLYIFFRPETKKSTISSMANDWFTNILTQHWANNFQIVWRRQPRWQKKTHNARWNQTILLARHESIAQKVPLNSIISFIIGAVNVRSERFGYFYFSLRTALQSVCEHFVWPCDVWSTVRM